MNLSKPNICDDFDSINDIHSLINNSKIYKKYGLELSDADCIAMCSCNELIIPKFLRYEGMGCYKIIATYSEDLNKIFIINAGGVNGYESENNYKKIQHLSLNDSIDFNKFVEYLKSTSWDEIISIDHFDAGEIREVIQHNPN